MADRNPEEKISNINMKLKSSILCFFGFHRWDGGYWYEARLVYTTKEEWAFIKTCVHCKHRRIG